MQYKIQLAKSLHRGHGVLV